MTSKQRLLGPTGSLMTGESLELLSYDLPSNGYLTGLAPN